MVYNYLKRKNFSMTLCLFRRRLSVFGLPFLPWFPKRAGFTSMPPSEYLLFHNVVCVSQAVARLSRTFFDFASCSHITGSDRAALEDLGFARVSKS